MRHWKETGRRGLSVLLASVMCVSMLNLTAFAAEEQRLICDKTEHTHDETCYTTTDPELTCELEGHEHDSGCYELKLVEELTCVLEESNGHAHSQDCYGEPPLTCDKDEIEGHTHGGACYETTTVYCGITEHTHGEGCSNEEGNLTCGQEEHAHSDACATTEPKLTCELEVSAGHTHGTDCYGEAELTCGTEIGNGAHKHTEDCYREVEKSVLTCDKHVHDDACYGEAGRALACPLEEHRHTDDCYETVVTEITFDAETGTLTITGVQEELTTAVVEGYLTANGAARANLKELVLNNVGSIKGYALSQWTALEKVTINGADSIGDHAFFKCANLNTVELANVGTVDSNAFSENDLLVKVSLENIELVGVEAFRHCDTLSDLSMKNIRAFERSPFSYCVGLTSLELDGEQDGISALSTTMFYWCSNLETVTLKNMDSIGLQAFNGCTGLKTVALENIKATDNQVFYGCTALENVTMDNVDTIGSNVLQNCTGSVTLTLNNIGTIDKNAFASCKALTTVDMSSIGTIGQYAFYNCTGLEQVTMGSVNLIDNYAFWNCSNLTRIDSLSNVTGRIGGFAFYGCSKLEGLTIADATKMGYIGSDAWVMDRVRDILAGTFKLENAEEIKELELDSGWTVGVVGQSDNWNTYSNGTQLMEQARWQNVDSGIAEVKVDAYYTGEKQMDYIFVADLSASMAQLGNADDSNARFYDMQSKLLDMTDQLLNTPGYDCQVAIVTFGGEHQNNWTQKNSGFMTEAGEAAEYIEKLEPLNENTDYGLGLQEALTLVKNNTGRNTVVVFLSDGQPNRNTSGDQDGTKAAAEIKQLGVDIFGVLHSPTAAQRDTAWSKMNAVCSSVYESTNTQSFGEAMNAAFAAVYGEYTVTIPVNAADFDMARLVPSAGNASYSDGRITWSINDMPFTQHTLTYTMSLKDELINVPGTHTYNINNGDASFGNAGGASVDLTMTLTRIVEETLYTLTIRYQYADGTPAAEDEVLRLKANDSYEVTSPSIAGYTADLTAVIGEMPEEDVEVIVTYTAITTPGGGGGGTDPTPGPDTPTPDPEPTPAPPTEEVITPEDVPLVETPEEEEISETDVPMTETPTEEPVVEEIIPDDVPLSEVPKTGDNSGIWYAMALLSACGLAVLTFAKKREQ